MLAAPGESDSSNWILLETGVTSIIPAGVVIVTPRLLRDFLLAFLVWLFLKTGRLVLSSLRLSLLETRKSDISKNVE